MVKGLLRKFLKGAKGSAILEFAIVAPFLMFLTMLVYEGFNFISVNGRVHDTSLLLARALSSSTITYDTSRCGNICDVIKEIPQYSLGRYNKYITVTAYGINRNKTNNGLQLAWTATWAGESGKSTSFATGVANGSGTPLPSGTFTPAVREALVTPQSAITVKVQYIYKPLFKILFSTKIFTAQSTTVTQSGETTIRGNCNG
jgi:Flp pilus assembly protein TadG